ncbi:MAG: thioredoxin-disulfide reductase [Lachnospiraceae bacterium]|nr:thioredoxin-disulfide reductase [Lachnospiraceae bacterium]
MYDLIIIGSGPAGLSAAVYGKRAGLNLLVIEKNGMSGGQVLNTYEVDNYLGLPGINGFDMGMQFRAHADKLQAEFRDEAVMRIENEEGKKKVVTEQNTYETKTVLIATGASHAKLNVPGEEELAGMGVSYCATCDGAFFRNRTVAVVGGGDVAAEDAIFLARGCEKVYLVHRRDELRAANILQKNLMELSNVEILWNHVVTSIEGDGQTEKMIIRSTKDESVQEKEIDGIFIAVGIHPNTAFVEGLLEMDEKGYIKAGEDGKTSVDGIFAAGDVRTKKLRQIITAVSDGANAVTSVQEYLLSK